jgi:uncharacterized membrane protein
MGKHQDALTTAVIGLVIVVACVLIVTFPLALIPLSALGISYACWRICKGFAAWVRKDPTAAVCLVGVGVATEQKVGFRRLLMPEQGS